MEITVRVDVQYRAPDSAAVRDVLQMFRTSSWLTFVMNYVTPRLKASSPAAKCVLDHLEANCKVQGGDRGSSSECSICLDGSESPSVVKETDSGGADQIQLPCGHTFHSKCIRSWLRVQSTCPICRFQFARAFKGRYAVHALHSTLLLAEPFGSSTDNQDAISGVCVANEILRIRVHVTLLRVSAERCQGQYSCEMSAWVAGENGYVFCEDAAPPQQAELLEQRRYGDESNALNSKPTEELSDL